jgi:hypothetical protein
VQTRLTPDSRSSGGISDEDELIYIAGVVAAGVTHG